METIKVIDLLNKIANGEEVPKKIKWEDTIYAYSDYDKDYLEFPFSEEEYRGLFNMKDSILTQFLNDEVEIIEEVPKKIEQIGKSYNIRKFQSESQSYYYDMNQLIDMVQDIYDKQHEIINKINGE